MCQVLASPCFCLCPTRGRVWYPCHFTWPLFEVKHRSSKTSDFRVAAVIFLNAQLLSTRESSASSEDKSSNDSLSSCLPNDRSLSFRHAGLSLIGKFWNFFKIIHPGFPCGINCVWEKALSKLFHSLNPVQKQPDVSHTRPTNLFYWVVKEEMSHFQCFVQNVRGRKCFYHFTEAVWVL